MQGPEETHELSVCEKKSVIAALADIKQYDLLWLLNGNYFLSKLREKNRNTC